MAKLKATKPSGMDDLFVPHMVDGKVGDRHSARVLKDALAGFTPRTSSVQDDKDRIEAPVRYGYRSFDRQYIIPDKRLINRPNPELWELRSDNQIFATAPSDRTPTVGPALSFTSLVPDLHHYNGRGGRTLPLWANARASEPNLKLNVLNALSDRYRKTVSAEDLFAYIAGIGANAAYTARFQSDLSTPGLRIPITDDAMLFAKAAEVGRNVLWLHTFGDRMADPDHDRPAQPPRLPGKTSYHSEGWRDLSEP